MSSSYQTSLPSSVTPGWNDPPSIGSAGSGSRLNRHRRVVDPSITGVGGAAPAYGAAAAFPGQPPQPVQQQQHYGGGIAAAPVNGFGSYGSPQQLQQTAAAPYAQQPPAYNFQPQQQQPQMSPYNAAVAAAPQPPAAFHGGPSPAAADPSHHTNIYNAFNVQASNAAGLTQFPPKQANPMPINAWSANHSTPSQPQASSTPPAPSAASLPRVDPNNPAHLIFAPPNAVDGGQHWHSPTQPDPASYIPPVKAAGDVSLSGPQLVSFLIKATFRLPHTKCVGVQMRLGSLHQAVQAGSFSDPFIKKFNFVVDALDREMYDEAAGFWEQLQMAFPEETATSCHWVHGVRLLISEMRSQQRPASRHAPGSAPAGGRTH